ncbi:MAG: Proline--tRNA ligase [Chloroflexi bacterium ADurb.Bin360]|nr:MAG: Proline--tRNA ligase [Chloroflexi bacterium ADurb.Bin360]
MRMTRLFSQTLREAPAEAEAASHQLLLRAGFIRPLATGIFSYLPLARRALTKIERIVREEIEAIGGQEITMPVVHPASLWKETGRWFQIGAEMGRFQDRADRDMVLAMTHEEVIADLVRKEIRSYRQLPQLLYHIQTKWRDDPRPRAGLIRVREFTMKDSYSLDADWEGLDKQYRAHYQAYFNIFNRCGLDVIAVASDTGMMGGAMAHEFMALLPIGEDTLMLCDACGYAANRQVAAFRKPLAAPEQPLPLDEIATPNVTTIADLAAFLALPTARTAKAVFMVATVAEGETESARFIFAVVRGDMDVNETKLANAVHAKALRPALEEEIRAIGAEPGYGSPLGVHHAIIIADDAVASSPNLVAGANRPGFHLRNVNIGRDFSPDIIADIAAAEAGDACPQCGAPLRAERGVEVGNIFKLGTRYSEALGCLFETGDREMKPVIMGSYGIGIGRALACIAEVHHDEQGLRWPISVAPYQVQLVVLGGKGIDALPVADRLYEELWAAGVEVLYDDREATPGVKFNDADLVGLPLRLTVAPRGLASGMVELKRRDRQERELVPLEEIITRIKKEIAVLDAEVNALRATRSFS